MAFEVLESLLPAQAAAGADSTTVVGTVPDTESQQSWQAQKVALVPPPGGAVALNAANNVSFTVGYVRGGAARVVFATLTTAATSLAAEVEAGVPINAANNNLQPGDVIDCLMHQNGTGVVVAAGVQARVELG